MSSKQTREELEGRVEELEETVEFLKDTIWTMEDHLYGRGMESYDSSSAENIVKEDGGVFQQIDSVQDRISKIERGEVDPGEVVANASGPNIEDLLPIHQMYLTASRVEANEHDLSNNQEIAARLFPHIIPAATPEGNERLRITSPKVKDLIKREVATNELAKRLDVENPNRNTVKRAMQFVGKFGQDVLAFQPASETGRKANEIVIDRDAWLDYSEKIGQEQQGLTSATGGSEEEYKEPVQDGAEQTMDQLDSARRAETDGGDVTLS